MKWVVRIVGGLALIVGSLMLAWVLMEILKLKQ